MKSLSSFNQKFLVVLYSLSFIFSCQQILAASKCKKDNIFYSILDETGLSNIFYTLNFFKETHPISSELESYEYISKAIKHRCVDVEVLLDKLKNLALQDTQSFNELSTNINSDEELIRILTEETKDDPYQRLKLSLVRNNIPLESRENDSFDNEFDRIFQHIYIGDVILGYDHKIFLRENRNTVKSVSHKVRTELMSLKKKYPIISDVLRIVEVYIKKNPNVRLVLLGYDNDIAKRYHGVYLHLDRSFLMVLTLGNFPNEGSWIDTFIHELTHFAMDILYNNAANPFKGSDTLAIQSYNSVIRVVNEVLSRNSPYKHYNNKVVFYEKEVNGKIFKVSSYKPYCLNHAFSLFEGIHNYQKESRDSEYIARAVQLFVSSERLGLSSDPEEDRLAVKEILEPFTEYWQEYIKPDMDKYISENSENDNLLVCEEN